MIRSDFFAPRTKYLPVINVHILHLIRTNMIGWEEKNTFAFQMNNMFKRESERKKRSERVRHVMEEDGNLESGLNNSGPHLCLLN